MLDRTCRNFIGNPAKRESQTLNSKTESLSLRTRTAGACRRVGLLSQVGVRVESLGSELQV